MAAEDFHEDWGPFRLALGLMLVGGFLAVGAGGYLLFHVHLSDNSQRYYYTSAAPDAGGATAALVALGLGLTGLVLMATAVILTHGVPVSTGLRPTSKACAVALGGALVAAVALVYAINANDLARRGNWVPAWSDAHLSGLWLATLLLVGITQALWLILLGQVARYQGRVVLAWTIYVFLAASAATVISGAVLLQTGSLSPNYTYRRPLRVAVDFVVQDDGYTSNASTVAIAWQRDTPPLLPFVLAFMLAGMVFIHQILVALVRRATWRQSGLVLPLTRPEIPSDWRLDRRTEHD
jgi:hypothetical protein